MSFKDQIDIEKLPKHVAIIMDGNGRWARQRGKQRVYGHRHGVKAVRATAEAAAELGIRYLTLYAFSTENWKRPKNEVDALMRLLLRTIGKETATLMKNDIRLDAIGDLGSLDRSLYSELMTAIKKTSGNKRMTLILALSYSARMEIVEAAKKIAMKVLNKELSVDNVDNDLFRTYLTTASFPEPELLIRTSGEFRLSNFLLWQLAYSELYFTSKMWPDFGKEDFYEAIVDYQHRERRFGMTSEQIN
jgi:undecaprenyl diphosphate synthase